MALVFEPIGTIFSPFKTRDGMPIQAAAAKGIKGKIMLKKEFVEGITDLDGFSHIILVYYFHHSSGFDLLTKPFLDDKKHGVFATRAPGRPNQLGLSVVRLLDIQNNILHIENVDVIDETPLLDIKPYIPDFDCFQTEKIGWYENKTANMYTTKSQFNPQSGNQMPG